MPLVQTSGGVKTTGSNAALTFAAPLTAGNASIVICASWYGGTDFGLASVTGSVNGAYTRAAINPTASNFVEVWYKLGVAAGSETIALANTAPDGNRYQTARAMEWSGVAAFDKSGGLLGLLTDGASHYVPASAPNSAADSLVVGGFAWNNGAATAVWIAGAGESVLWSETDSNSFTAASLNYKTVAAVETSRLSQGLAFVPGPGNVVGAVATFSLAAAPVAYTLDVTPAAVTIAAPAALLAQARQLNVTLRAYTVARPSALLARSQIWAITPTAYLAAMPAADLTATTAAAVYALDAEPLALTIATPAASLSLAARLDLTPAAVAIAWSTASAGASITVALVSAYTIAAEARTTVIPAERRTWSITRG